MRRRTGGAIAAVVIAGGALALPTAYADPPDLSETTADQVAFATTTGTVELPTGDRVTVLPGGNAKFDPAEGREDIGFLTMPMSDSDEIIIVPTDKVTEMQAGLEDPRRYNVTRLLEAGITDAADAPQSALDAREYDGLMPGAVDPPATNVAARALDIVVRDRSGDAPGNALLMWASIDGSRSDTVPIDKNGAGRVSLRPGEYVIVSGFWNKATEDERGEMVLGMTAVTVGRAPNRLVIDAAAAQPVRAEVERDDAELVHAEVAIAADAAGLPLGLGNSVPARTDLFLLPEPDLPELDLGFIYQPVFTSPAGSADPYTYNLALGEDGGFPDDTDYAIADDELAQVTTELQDLGVAVPGATCDYGDFTDRRVGTGVCKVVPVDLPSTRTMLYTPGPDISWMHDVSGGLHDESGEMLEGFGTFETDVVHEAGPSEATVVHGPISPGPATAVRSAGGDSLILGGTISHGNSDNRESLTLYGYSGSVSLRREGELLGETEDPANFEFPIADEPGRYSLTSTASHSGIAGLFATESTQSWRFDLGAMPDEPEDVALPIVAMGIDGAEGGWVDRDEPIEVNLQLLAGVNAFPVEASKMTFEVSYNDGRTWHRVNLDRDGGTATAELRTPSRAEFVSVRMTAVDTHGTKVSHTTIRSFGLD